MRNALTFIRAAWEMRDCYGWQDWTCPVDRAAMIRDYRLQ